MELIHLSFLPSQRQRCIGVYDSVGPLGHDGQKEMFANIRPVAAVSSAASSEGIIAVRSYCDR